MYTWFAISIPGQGAHCRCENCVPRVAFTLPPEATRKQGPRHVRLQVLHFVLPNASASHMQAHSHIVGHERTQPGHQTRESVRRAPPVRSHAGPLIGLRHPPDNADWHHSANAHVMCMSCVCHVKRVVPPTRSVEHPREMPVAPIAHGCMPPHVFLHASARAEDFFAHIAMAQTPHGTLCALWASHHARLERLGQLLLYHCARPSSSMRLSRGNSFTLFLSRCRMTVWLARSSQGRSLIVAITCGSGASTRS